MTSIVHIA